jgi:hypothetical protein
MCIGDQYVYIAGVDWVSKITLDVNLGTLGLPEMDKSG